MSCQHLPFLVTVRVRSERTFPAPEFRLKYFVITEQSEQPVWNVERMQRLEQNKRLGITFRGLEYSTKTSVHFHFLTSIISISTIYSRRCM